MQGCTLGERRGHGGEVVSDRNGYGEKKEMVCDNCNVFLCAF